jgi:hypothetical protein
MPIWHGTGFLICILALLPDIIRLSLNQTLKTCLDRKIANLPF